nr:MAG TPA: hypothetical protein [Caudoviricetes sp.]DAZ43871.1 MAG TPA: hypothetical protein [Caudoviricetes sp.]
MNAQRSSPRRDLEMSSDYQIRVEIPNIQIIRSTTQPQMGSVKTR